jgi:cell division protein ZapA
MPEVKVMVGGRAYEVACQEGEEGFLNAAARMLDAESAALGGQLSRIPETRVLLMAGLMLADKTAGLEDQIRALESRLHAAEAEVETQRSRPAAAPERIEVPVVPLAVTEALADLAARAEALAARAEERAGAA